MYYAYNLCNKKQQNAIRNLKDGMAQVYFYLLLLSAHFKVYYLFFTAYQGVNPGHTPARGRGVYSLVNRE